MTCRLNNPMHHIGNGVSIPRNAEPFAPLSVRCGALGGLREEGRYEDGE